MGLNWWFSNFTKINEWNLSNVLQKVTAAWSRQFDTSILLWKGFLLWVKVQDGPEMKTIGQSEIFQVFQVLWKNFNSLKAGIG